MPDSAPVLIAFGLVGALLITFGFQLSAIEQRRSEKYRQYAYLCLDSGREPVECAHGFLTGTVSYVPAGDD